MHRFEETIFAPTLAGLKNGRKAQVRLVLSNRSGHQAFVTTKLAQNAFWRKPTLDSLLP
jgi:hypothetical protein